MVVAEKFSARGFWDDIDRWDCTLFQYIGELCRYLLAAPPHPKERAHALRLCCGNGLAADVWEAFQARFAIPRILEFYAATEGNFSLYNVEGKPGRDRPAAAVPRPPLPGRHRALRCGERRAGAGRGRPLHRAPSAARSARRSGASRCAGPGRFEGYTDAAATEQKLLRDVFEPGDAWVRTGDLMYTDAQGFWWFVDRVGDTFRWKGENVATAEVAAAIRSCDGVADACVYGVEVPGASGRAGMAAIVPAPGFDAATLRAHLAARLPDYARPVFLRLVDALEVTETFKQKKQALAADGWDPARVDGPLLVEDRAAGAYVALDAAIVAAHRGGRNSAIAAPSANSPSSPGVGPGDPRAPDGVGGRARHGHGQAGCSRWLRRH